ncbi:hypothetical protein BDA99DRAFT_569638 [Phascolomyces articulosus]|uniref:Actin-like ATPase domain-containing protein n=1 Tax=Phascolomyces articulosus TaxID=60185 RepID=A0AAD5K6Y9_9FUNG|nr:hypothetical protein BDA99DRAFT_569638 [Phascolomyces articulosus]
MLYSNPQQLPPEYRVIIAYDFGTTYSGAAYAFTHTTPTEVFDIQSWPHKGGNFYPKVPTAAVYPRNSQQQSKSFGRSSLYKWGYSAKKEMLKPDADKESILISRFKLHLDESLLHPHLKNGLTVVETVADYLSALHEHTLDELSRSFAKNYHPDTFRYCLTVPAVWTDKAKNLMRQAAIQAGLINPSDPSDRLILVSEPEAAALYCEETMSDQVQLKDNDRIMICDAGGGTVDLIVFQVNFKYTNSSSGGRINRELKEVTKGMGDCCGSVFLDNGFYGLLKIKLGTHVMSKITPRDLHSMMGYFIGTIKPEFDEEEYYYVELPRSVNVEDLPESTRNNHANERDLDNGILKFSGQELKEQVFDPVVNRVIEFILQQYDQIPDGRLNFLFLVGGFGSSKYLYERVCRVFEGTNVNQIICPAERAALAVVRGAVYYGIRPETVVSRVSRRTYGIRTNADYDETFHSVSRCVLAPNGTMQSTGLFFPFVKKYDEVDVDYCISRDLLVFYDPGSIMSTDIYATENDFIPIYCDEPGVNRIANMTITIPEMKGINKYEPVNITTRMYFGRTEVRFEAEFLTGEKHHVSCDIGVAFN